MQAVFRFRGDEEIVVSSQASLGVMVETYKGIEPGIHGGPDVASVAHYRTECSEEKCGQPPMLERQRAVLLLSKPEARSVASAMMGAAAEL